MTTARTPDHPVDPLILERWSPRAFVPVAIEDGDLRSLLEAARWAPSSFNSQPWQFVYARRDTAEWGRLFDLLIPFNQSWVKNASLLILCLSDRLMPAGQDGERKVSHSHSFDAGAAWAMLALQATRLGLAAHAMTGLDVDRARELLAVPDHLRVECAIAVGQRGPASSLPDHLQAREQPSGRKPQTAFAFEGALAG